MYARGQALGIGRQALLVTGGADIRSPGTGPGGDVVSAWRPGSLQTRVPPAQGRAGRAAPPAPCRWPDRLATTAAPRSFPHLPHSVTIRKPRSSRRAEGRSEDRAAERHWLARCVPRAAADHAVDARGRPLGIGRRAFLVVGGAEIVLAPLGPRCRACGTDPTVRKMCIRVS